MSIHPTEIKLHQNSRLLEVNFEDGAHFQLPCEYLRVFSPSAEVRGHGPGTETLVTGKETVNISAIEPIGHYAVRLVFDDGHATGLYSWNVLYDLGKNQANNWQDYLRRLADAGYQRRA
ncbi:MAG: DUF971 domain-containing protein [Candidatus Competibacteraceae bacterium]|nr:DUF971 domain-containing protein [Candidatus Competibacteraceae bacterium]